MGLRDDLKRFQEVGEERRVDLTEFIEQHELGYGDQIRVPIKIIQLPEFAYIKPDMGGVGQGQGGTPEEGEKVGDVPTEEGDGEGEPGEESTDHSYYEMDPEEFAQELDEELGLDLEPKGKEIIEESDGEFTDVARQGPSTMLDLEHFFKRGLQRKLSMEFDEDYVREAIKVRGATPKMVYQWARNNNITVPYRWIQREFDTAGSNVWESFDEMEANVEQQDVATIIREDGIRDIPFRPEDERYRHQSVTKKKQCNAVIINIRDVSGSMGEDKRDLIERVFTPMDWYLQGKYDNAEFHYIAHDSSAWEVNREDFFGIQSGGGTQISSAYELARDILEDYPYSEWNRFVFAAGDGENRRRDTDDNVIPMMEEISANKQAYVQAKPRSASFNANHGELVADHFDDDSSVTVSYVQKQSEVVESITEILNGGD